MEFLANPSHSEILVRKTYCIGQADLVNHSEHSHVKADRNYAIALPPHSCHHNQSPSSGFNRFSKTSGFKEEHTCDYNPWPIPRI